MSTEQTESTTRLPAVAGPGQEQRPAEDAGTSGGQPPTGPAEWGAPPPPAAPRPKWTAKRIVIAAVVAVGIAAAGGAAIYAASGSVDNSQGGGPGGEGGGPGGGRMVMGGPMTDMQHGEFQTGDVTAISDDSITVKSEDGYEETYVINDDTQVADGIEQGDEVTVIATTESDKATASSVIEFGTMPGGGQGNRQNGGGNNQQPPNGTPPSN